MTTPLSERNSPVWPAWPGYKDGYQPILGDQIISQQLKTRGLVKPPKNHRFSNPDADHRLSEITQRNGQPKKQPHAPRA